MRISLQGRSGRAAQGASSSQDRASRERACLILAALSLAGLAPATLPEAALAQAAPTPPSPGAILQPRIQPPISAMGPQSAGVALPPTPQQNLPPGLSVDVRTITITGNRLIATPVLAALLAPMKGRTVTLAALDAAVGEITRAYHARGFPLAYAYLPQQQITDGDIQVRVVEPRFDQVEVKGKTRLRTEVIDRTVGVAPGDVVQSAPLDRGMLLLNQTPGVHVNGELAAGSSPETTTLNLLPHDQPAIIASLTEDNDGNASAGAYLTALTVTANDLLGYGESVSANGLVSQNGDFYSGGLSATSPDLWNGLRLGLYGSSTFYRLGGAFTSLNQVGSASVVGGDAQYPLVLTNSTALGVRLDVYNTWLNETTHSTGTYSQQVIPMGKFSLIGSYSDRFGGFTSGAAAILAGRLDLSPATAVANDAAGVKAAGDFWISQLQVQRQQTLPQGFALNLTFNGQISGQNLDSSQKIFIGGPMGVMGYPVGVIGGDQGYVMSFRLSHALTGPKSPGLLSVSLLAQTGAVWINRDPPTGVTGGRDVRETAVGGGLDYSLKGWTFNGIVSRRIGSADPQLPRTTRYQLWFVASRSFAFLGG